MLRALQQRRNFVFPALRPGILLRQYDVEVSDIDVLVKFLWRTGEMLRGIRRLGLDVERRLARYLGVDGVHLRTDAMVDELQCRLKVGPVLEHGKAALIEERR